MRLAKGASDLQKPILINGANGWLGSGVVRMAGPQRAAAGVRRESGKFDRSVLIGSDGAAPFGTLAKFDAIVNCAGRVAGTITELEQANVSHAFRLASDARDEGVRRFVQVSSFSIYGNAQKIELGTSSSPLTAYGQSKLNAENALLSLNTPEFTVTCVRLPFMFSSAKPAFMGRLIGALNRLPYWPTTAVPVRRSMITYNGAASVLLASIDDAPPGIIAASDPEPFTIEKLALAMRRFGYPTATLLPMPDWMTTPVRYLMPAIGRRLFQSNILSPPCNWAEGRNYNYSIELEIEAIIAQRMHLSPPQIGHRSG
jgi:nucleoside-diphosphate-sugar epimerase